MFKLEPNEHGYFTLVKSSEKQVTLSEHVCRSKGNTFTLGNDISISFESDDIMIVSNNSSESFDKYFGRQLFKLDREIKNHFGFSIIEVIQSLPNTNGSTTHIFGKTISSKGEDMHIITEIRNNCIILHLLAQSKAKVEPKLPTRFIKYGKTSFELGEYLVEGLRNYSCTMKTPSELKEELTIFHKHKASNSKQLSTTIESSLIEKNLFLSVQRWDHGLGHINEILTALAQPKKANFQEKSFESSRLLLERVLACYTNDTNILSKAVYS